MSMYMKLTPRQKEAYVIVFVCALAMWVMIALAAWCNGCEPVVVADVRTVMALPVVAETWNVSAYCLCDICIDVPAFRDGITASGYVIEPGDKFVAAPPSVPFGTMLTVPGYNDGEPVPVLDRGGAIKGRKLDLYFPSHKTALQWGRQHVAVTWH